MWRYQAVLLARQSPSPLLILKHAGLFYNYSWPRYIAGARLDRANTQTLCGERLVVVVDISIIQRKNKSFFKSLSISPLEDLFCLRRSPLLSLKLTGPTLRTLQRQN